MNSIIYVCFKTYHSCMNNMWAAHPAQGDNKKAGCKLHPARTCYFLTIDTKSAK